jgi:hypothetical protein
MASRMQQKLAVGHPNGVGQPSVFLPCGDIAFGGDDTRALTALVSVPTAILLVKLIPQALRLPCPERLEQANNSCNGRFRDYEV